MFLAIGFDTDVICLSRRSCFLDLRDLKCLAFCFRRMILPVEEILNLFATIFLVFILFFIFLPVSYQRQSCTPSLFLPNAVV